MEKVCKNIDPIIYNTLKEYDKVEKVKKAKALNMYK